MFVSSYVHMAIHVIQTMQKKILELHMFLNSTNIATIIIATLYQILDFNPTLVGDINNLLINAS